MSLAEMYKSADYKDKNGMLFNDNCMNVLSSLENGGRVNLTLTDIPYDFVSRSDNGLRNLDKSKADIMTFDLLEFLDKVYSVTDGVIIIFAEKSNSARFFHILTIKEKKEKAQFVKSYGKNLIRLL